MRKLSLWAKQHRAAARLSVIVIKLVLAFLAWYAGRLLSTMELALPRATGFVAVVIMITAAFCYPSRRTHSLRWFYLRQKSCDFVLAICTFIAMMAISNHQLYPVAGLPSHASSHVSLRSQPPTAEEVLASLQYRDKKSLTKQERKILRQEFKKQFRIFSASVIQGRKDEANNALLIILVIIGAIGLSVLLAALVCSISCGGADGAAVAVAILGTVAIVWLSVALIRRINRGPRVKNKNLAKLFEQRNNTFAKTTP